jgi:DNA-binding response OmpR family regulator
MKKHSVLIVEDDAHLLSGIKAILELGEYSVMTAHNGVEGLRVLGDQGDHLPDVIVSDITMPYMDGFRFLEEVRKQENWVRIPFIFLTAHGESHNKRKGALAGADVYLTKPFNAQDLLLQVSARIERMAGMVGAIDRMIDGKIDAMKQKILDTLHLGFRTPQTISAYAELFKELGTQAIPPEEIIPLLKNVNSGANQLRRLVENFITLVELDSGDAERTYEWRRRPVTNLYDHVMDAYQQITYPDDKPRAFECYIAEDLPEFTADVQMMTMAIRELLDNAAKFTPPGRPFILRAQGIDDSVEIQVQDFGPGIPRNQLESIWHAFYHSDSHYDLGVGSGLAIVHGIVQLHGGSHSIISDRRTGSTFTIRLPQQPSASTPRNSRIGGVNPMNPKYRVLIVEDDAHLLSGIKEILELEQYIVMTAHNGIEGLTVLRDQADQPPDIIVSDIAMPYMDGFHFLEEVRKQDSWVRIPFIFLTAHGERIDRHKGVQLGADDYLTKPFNAEDLIVTVKAKIERIGTIDAASNRLATNQVVDVKRKILTILNHEFRTPLTLVVAYAELLKEFDPESMDENDVMTFLKGVNSGANRLRRAGGEFHHPG